MHQIHIILHEVAHMLLQHPLHPIQEIMPPALLAELEQDAYGHLRTITRLKDVYEQEAEDFVYAIQKQIVYSERMVELTRGVSSIEDLKPFLSGLLYDEQAKR